MDIGEKNKIGDKKLKFKMIYHSMSSIKKYLLSLMPVKCQALLGLEDSKMKRQEIKSILLS